MPDDSHSDDWRLQGQERYLAGATLVRKRYHAYSETWEHDHCEFCQAKFMDADFSAAHRKFIDEHPEILAEGYTTTEEHAKGAGYYWMCENCFAEFADSFGWKVGGDDSDTSRVLGPAGDG
jgi:hypothetical protein